MKQQTFIAYIKDTDGNMIDFERFACKRAATVKRHMQQLFTNELYRVCTKGAATVEIYATPDGYTKEATPAVIMTV